MMVGLLIYLLTEPPHIVLTRELYLYKSLPVTKGIYSEVKDWGYIVGQFLGGIGGLGVVVKSTAELYKFVFRKNKQ